MVYDSEIHFTLDTICPWTYLAKRRLESALRHVNATAAAANDDNAAPPPVRFTLVFRPYQLYPDASVAGEDKYAWYRRSRYGDSEQKMQAYTTIMSAYGATEGIAYKFTGTVANTMQAHRVIQHFQETKGADTANRLVNSLYRQYFEEEKHPSSHETLLAATTEAGIPEEEAKAFIEDEQEGLMDVKMQMREQAGNGIDAVPHMVFMGKRRDVTVVGCQEGKEYVKAINSIIRESK